MSCWMTIKLTLTFLSIPGIYTAVKTLSSVGARLAFWVFSIVGGQEELHCNQSFFIRSIVEGTPAYNDGRIR